jgi:hypothetical protein
MVLFCLSKHSKTWIKHNIDLTQTCLLDTFFGPWGLWVKTNVQLPLKDKNVLTKQEVLERIILPSFLTLFNNTVISCIY